MTHGQALDMPDGPGWWAFEGQIDAGGGVIHDARQDVCEVFMFGGKLTAWMLRKGIWSISHMKGKFTRIYMPWEQPAPAMPQAEWANAPEWAMWWAVDPTGWSNWHEEEPTYKSCENYWWNRKRHVSDARISIPLGVDWRQTLQRRPAPAA